MNEAREEHHKDEKLIWDEIVASARWCVDSGKPMTAIQHTALLEYIQKARRRLAELQLKSSFSEVESLEYKRLNHEVDTYGPHV